MQEESSEYITEVNPLIFAAVTTAFYAAAAEAIWAAATSAA